MRDANHVASDSIRYNIVGTKRSLQYSDRDAIPYRISSTAGPQLSVVCSINGLRKGLRGGADKESLRVYWSRPFQKRL